MEIMRISPYSFQRDNKRAKLIYKPGRYCDKLLKVVDEQKYYDLKKKRHEDFYDSVDCLDYENVDLVKNNLAKETCKQSSVKILKRNL